MTSRQNEPYSLIPLQEIKGTILENTVFYHFKSDFIKGNGKIFDEPPHGDVPSMYYDPQAIGFFDSLHDFKSDFMDCQGNIKGNDTDYSYKKFGFSFLLNGGYPDLKNYENLIIQDKYSYLNRIPRPLNQDNLENYFALGNIYHVINYPDKGKMYILPNTRSSTFDNFTAFFGTNKEVSIYNSLAAIYSTYKDTSFGDKIKLIFDFQLNLFNIIRKSRKQNATVDHFCLLYTAETITDPAPKMKFDGILDVFGPNNFYFEKLDSSSSITERTFNASNDNVYGNVDVTFSNIQRKDKKYDDDKITKSTNFFVTTKYKLDNKTIQLDNKTIEEDIKMNSKANTIDTIKNKIRKTIESASTNLARAVFKKNAFPETNDSETRQGFYTSFNNDMNRSQDKKKYQRDYSIYYARKRLGDTLQGRICKLDKLQTLTFNQTTDKSGSISQVNKPATKDAVLVTHDRMLFSYAVTQSIPVILDLKDNMILYVPPQQAITQGGQKQIKNIKPKISKNDYPLYKSIKTGGIKLFDEEQLQEAADSIMNNVDSLIRFLYFFKNKQLNLTKEDNFRNFIKTVNHKLYEKELKYAYLGEYAVNTLIIADNEQNIINEIDTINTKANEYAAAERANRNVYPDTYHCLKINPTILKIVVDDKNEIEVNKYYNTGLNEYYLSVKVQYSTDKNTTNVFFYPGDKHNNDTSAYYRSIKKLLNDNISKYLTNLTPSSSNSEKLIVMQNLYEDISLFTDVPDISIFNRLFSNVLSNVENYIPQSLSDFTDSSTTQYQVAKVALILILISMILYYNRKSVLGFVVGGGGNGDKMNNSPYDKVLNASFDKLYDTTDLVEKNITSLYFMFSLLRQYELSFVNYQEGINVNYTKINESYILSDLIGVTNLIPHNIELYIFLKLLLRDYNENKLNSINYSLFEYYMYFYSGNILYSRFQNLKSYLNVYYTIDIDPKNIPNIVEKIQSQPVCSKSWEYFKNIMKETEAIKEQVISENYNAEQSGKYDIIYDNVEKYSLKLAGFTEMKSEFLSKTLDIISSMLTKGSLQKYVDEVKSITGNVPGDVAGVAPKPYKGLVKPNLFKSSFRQPIAVNGGGKRIRRKTRKNKKQCRKKTHKKIQKCKINIKGAYNRNALYVKNKTRKNKTKKYLK